MPVCPPDAVLTSEAGVTRKGEENTLGAVKSF